jgi:hypothetical protein
MMRADSETARWFAYARFEALPAFLALGWLYDGELPPPHGFYSCAIRWPDDSEPPWPVRGNEDGP